MPDEPWQVLADLVRRQREERHLSQQQLGEAAGTTGRLISDIERAARTNFEPATLRAVGRALGWTPDSVDLILAGNKPVEVEPESRAAPSDHDHDDYESRLAQLEADMAQVMAELGIERRPRPTAEKLRERLTRATAPAATPQGRERPA